ncbi:MAG TPA: Lrp/AsnC family transcriptional regulator [Solirubrobacterales bacterium]|nr:Lrp/AsnC family transcriptional regulator [Solirubrobacterales bacterium]
MNTLNAIDGTDLEIVALLEQDGRLTLAEVGKKVSLSPPAVKRRLDRLEAEGVITGYRAQVDYAKLGRPIEAFTELRFAGRTKVADIEGIAADLPEVDAVYTTAGDPDALVHMRVRDVADLTRVIDLLRRSGKVTGTKTLMVLATEIKVEGPIRP